MIRATLLFAFSFVVANVAFADWTKVAGEWDGYNLSDSDKRWFSAQKGKKGYCCSTADGHPTDWDIREGHYWAVLDDAWVQVPDEAVIITVNPVGKAVLWYTADRAIRCFIPGPSS